jgi:glucose-fructose oxidoreductase
MDLERTTNRRSFLYTTGLAAGAMALSLPTQTACKTAQKKEKLGVALVGLGYYSTDLLAPALQETKYATLAGIVTGTPAKAQSWKEKYDIPEKNIYNYENFDRIADNPDIDVVYVVLPNSMHKEYVIRAAKAGKHVFCEKPMAVTAADCREMIAACRENGVKLTIGYRMQHEPHTQEIMRIGKEKTLGPIRMITAGAGWRWDNPGDHWKNKKAYGGGAMMDMGVYSLQGARYAMGEEPVAVAAQQYTRRPEVFSEVDEFTSFQLQFPSGALANLHTSLGVNMNYLQVNADNGWYRLDPFQSYNGIEGESSQGPISFETGNQQAKQMDDDCYAIMNDEALLVPGEEGLRDMVIVEAIRQSVAEGGRWINLEG